MTVRVEVSATVAGRTYQLGSAELESPNDPALRQLFRGLASEVEQYAREILMADKEPTPPLDAFLNRYHDDSNEWWVLSCGHHLNLFLEAVERMQAAEQEVANGHRS